MLTYLEEASKRGYVAAKKAPTWNQWAAAYLTQRFFPDTGSRIVDIGAGNGAYLAALKSLGYANLCATDIDNLYADHFSALCIEFRGWDCRERACPFQDQSVDVVFNTALIEHLCDPDNMLEEIFRILRPGGVIVLETCDWSRMVRSFYNDHTHVRPYTRVSIEKLMRAHGFVKDFCANYGTKWGLGRLRAYRLWPRLGFLGRFLIYVGHRPGK